jgi:hypothetical protein
VVVGEACEYSFVRVSGDFADQRLGSQAYWFAYLKPKLPNPHHSSKVEVDQYETISIV